MAQSAGTPQPPLTPTSTSGGMNNNVNSGGNNNTDASRSGTVSQQFLAPGPVVPNNKPRPSISSPIQSPLCEGNKNVSSATGSSLLESKSDLLANSVDQS